MLRLFFRFEGLKTSDSVIKHEEKSGRAKDPLLLPAVIEHPIVLTGCSLKDTDSWLPKLVNKQGIFIFTLKRNSEITVCRVLLPYWPLFHNCYALKMKSKKTHVGTQCQILHTMVTKTLKTVVMNNEPQGGSEERKLFWLGEVHLKFQLFMYQ